MKRKWTKLVLLMFIVLFTPGCWDMQDVNNTAFVLSLGIDEPADPDNAKYLVTFEFAKPVAAGYDSSTQSTVASVEASSIRQAIQRVQTGISRSVCLSHLRLVVFGEEIARKENFHDLANYLMREPNSALQLRLIFVQNALARDAFFTDHRFEPRLAAEVVAMGQLQKELSYVRTNNFLDFIIDLNETEGTALASRTVLNKGELGEDIILREGAAVYKDWKLAAWLTAEEAHEANWLIEKTEAVVVAGEGANNYTYEVDKQKAKIKPSFKEGKPSFIVNLTTEGMILEEAGKDLELDKSENIKKMESLLCNTIKQQVESAIAKSQKEIKADYLGFGKAFAKFDNKTYQTLNWPEIYPTIPIEVNVSCDIKAYGLRK